MTGFNSKRAMAANKLQEPAQPMADWDSPQVRIVYEILIDGETPPNTDEHWEGFVARKIVAALAQPAQEPVCDKDPQGCWNVRCQLGKQCKNSAQPAQEPVECLDCGSHNVGVPANYDSLVDSVKEQPRQEPVAYVTGMSFGRFIVEPLNPAMVLPVGMALYSSPQGNK